jgi:predicted transcriptional regulator
MLKVSQLLDIIGTDSYPKKMITRAQIRAARALIGWTQADLAQASGVSEVAIKNLERGVTDPRVSTISNIRAAFDEAGVIFLDAGDIRNGGVGVRYKERGTA